MIDTPDDDDDPRYHPDHIDDNRNSNPGAQAIHPPPSEATPAQLADDPILRFFHYMHLPPALRTRSAPFCELALHIVRTTPRNAERTVALRKLLEAKDCAVRAALP